MKRGERVNVPNLIVAKFESGEPLSSGEEEILYSSGTVEQVASVFVGYPR